MTRDFVCPTCRYVKCRCPLADEPTMNADDVAPVCRHTEHALRGDGVYGRYFEKYDSAGQWESCRVLNEESGRCEHGFRLPCQKRHIDGEVAP